VGLFRVSTLSPHAHKVFDGKAPSSKAIISFSFPRLMMCLDEPAKCVVENVLCMFIKKRR
jgi:hypothetical protein